METVEIGKLTFVVAPEVVETPAGKASSSIPQPKRKVRPRKTVSQSKLILAIAQVRGLENVRKFGDGGMIDSPMETNGWLVMPIDQYQGIIPPEAMQQAETLTKGIPIQGFLIADDKRLVDKQSQKKASTAPQDSTDWGEIAIGLGKVAAVVAIGVAVITCWALVLGIAGLGAAIAYDPIIIAVTKENEWIAVAEWWEEPG